MPGCVRNRCDPRFVWIGDDKLHSKEWKKLIAIINAAEKASIDLTGQKPIEHFAACLEADILAQKTFAEIKQKVEESLDKEKESCRHPVLLRAWNKVYPIVEILCINPGAGVLWYLFVKNLEGTAKDFSNTHITEKLCAQLFDPRSAHY